MNSQSMYVRQREATTLYSRTQSEAYALDHDQNFYIGEQGKLYSMQMEVRQIQRDEQFLPHLKLLDECTSSWPFCEGETTER